MALDSQKGIQNLFFKKPIKWAVAIHCTKQWQ